MEPCLVPSPARHEGGVRGARVLAVGDVLGRSDAYADRHVPCNPGHPALLVRPGPQHVSVSFEPNRLQHASVDFRRSPELRRQPVRNSDAAPWRQPHARSDHRARMRRQCMYTCLLPRARRCAESGGFGHWVGVPRTCDESARTSHALRGDLRLHLRYLDRSNQMDHRVARHDVPNGLQWERC